MADESGCLEFRASGGRPSQAHSDKAKLIGDGTGEVPPGDPRSLPQPRVPPPPHCTRPLIAAAKGRSQCSALPCTADSARSYRSAARLIPLGLMRTSMATVLSGWHSQG